MLGGGTFLAASTRHRHLLQMHSDFSVFRERLQEACRVRNLTQDKLCSSISLGGMRDELTDTAIRNAREGFQTFGRWPLHLLATVRLVSRRLASPDFKAVALVFSKENEFKCKGRICR
jgi:hypothetical protein